MAEHPNCELCGDPMPEGEEMFKFHGYSGPCPKPPTARRSGLVRSAVEVQRDDLLAALRDLLNVIAADELIPESVSYMRQARAAIAKAEP